MARHSLDFASRLGRALRPVVASVVLSALCHADMIILKNGREYEGDLISADAETVVFRQGEEETRYPRADIVHIRLQKQREWDAFDSADDIPDAALQAARKIPFDPRQFPGAGIETLHSQTTIRLDSPVTWAVKSRSIVRVLSDHGSASTVQRLQYRKAEESIRILHGTSIREDGTAIHLRDTAIQQENPYADLPRYDTIARRRFALPEGKPGTILDLAVETVRHTPVPHDWFLREATFGGGDPARNISVSVSVPDGCSFKWELLNNPEGTVTHTTARDGTRTVHTWERKQAPQLLPESMMPPTGDIVPRLVVSTQPGDWHAVALAYRDAVAEREGTLGDLPPAPADTVEELWNWVSRNVQANSVALAASGRLPGSPAETFTQRRGSDLDRTYLLCRWLQSTCAPNASLVWVRHRNWGQRADDVPALAQFQTPAIRVPGHNPEFLFPGDDLAHIAEPPVPYSGASCLTVPEGVDTVPIAAPDTLGVDRLITVRLDAEGNAEVVDRTVLNGGAARSLRSWRRMTQEDIVNQVQMRARSVDAEARDIRHEATGVASNTPRAELTLTYTVPGFADMRSKVCSLRPPWLDYEARSVGRNTREFPLQWTTPARTRTEITVSAPDGMSLYAGPEAQTDDCPVADLTLTRSGTPTETSVTLTYQRTALSGRMEDYFSLKTCLEQRAGIGRQYWVWRRKE